MGWRRCVSLMFVGVLFVVSASASAAAPPDLERIIQDEVYWISLAQVPPGAGPASGAIARFRLEGGSEWAYVSPYDASIAAQGMLAAGSRYHPMVKSWIEWYFSHLNWPDYSGLYGSIHDYWVNPVTGQERLVMDPLTGQPRYDSTDAYAGVFLSLLRDYAEAAPTDAEFLRAHRYQMDVLANVVIATLHPNDLTGARPDWYGEYLLDNIDAEQGLVDYAWLARTVLGQPAVANYWDDMARRLRVGVERNIWFEDRQMYGWASDQPSPAWAVFYPDAAVQAWPLIYGYGSASRRQALWSSFNAAWPAWTTSADNPGTPEPQPWATLAYAAAVQGDSARAFAWLSGSESNWVARGRPLPWSVNDSAWRALTALRLKKAG